MMTIISPPMPVGPQPGCAQFNLDDGAANRRNTDLLLLRRSTELKLFAHTFLRHRTAVGSESLVLVRDGLSRVWIDTEPVESEILDRKTLRVRADWQNPGHEYRSLVCRLYLDHYLPTYGVLESDGVQRGPGKSLWLNIVRQALRPWRNLYVYAYTVDRLFQRIYADHELARLSDSIWGPEPEYLQARVFISKSPIESLTRMPSFSAVGYELFWYQQRDKA